MNAKLMIVAVVAGLAACGGKGGKTTAAGPGGAPLALPGPCVDIVADATARQGHTEQQPDDRVGPDLDGDGTADHQVLTTDPEGLVTEHVFYYVLRGDCGHFVGDLGAVDATPGADSHGGLPDVSVLENSMCEGARCGCEYGTTWFRFDGTAYVKDAAASTESSEKECPDGD